MQSKHFPDLMNRTSTKRAEFLPVEWRNSLRLDAGIVETITPSKLRGLRWLLNSTGMDVLYYTSPLHRSEVSHLHLHIFKCCMTAGYSSCVQFRFSVTTKWLEGLVYSATETMFFCS